MVGVLSGERNWPGGVPPKKTKEAGPSPREIDPADHYRRILRKKHWRSIPAPVLARCYAKMQGVVDALPRSELLETVVTLSALFVGQHRDGDIDNFLKEESSLGRNGNGQD